MIACPIEDLFLLNLKKASHVYEDYFYRHQRYGLSFSIALFYSNDILDEGPFTNSIRKSDKFLALKENLFCLFFDITSVQEGFKACQNVLASYEAKHYSQKLYIAYLNTTSHSNQESMQSSLLSLLNYAIKENKSNQITDEYNELEHL